MTIITLRSSLGKTRLAKINEDMSASAARVEADNWSAGPIQIPPTIMAPGDLVINEIDADTAGVDAAEFVELYDGGLGNMSLNGYVLVFFNGGAANDASYRAMDLDGFSTDANGYFLIGNSAVPGVGLVFPNDTLQNGADAVALYLGNASDFPNGTAPTTTNLIDAIVYDTADPDDAALLAALGETTQYDENSGGNGTGHGLARVPNETGGFVAQAPTPGAANVLTETQTVVFNPTSVTQAEGDSGATIYTFTVTRTGGTTGQLDFSGTFSAGGTDAQDYVGGTAPTGFSGSILAGQSSGTFTIEVQGDDIVESSESFTLTLTSVSNASANVNEVIGANNVATGNITNDDAAGALSIADVTAAEGNSGTTAFIFTVTRSGGDDGAVSADWTLNLPGGAGGADAGDIAGGQPPSGTVSFADGETSKTITVLVQGDTAFEPTETFTVTLGNAQGGVTIADGSGTGTITNDDAAPAGDFSVNDVTLAEGNGGPTTFTFTVTRSGGSAGAVTADWAISAPGGAGNASTDDFVIGAILSGQVSFADGETSKTISVDVQGDTVFEPDETFTVTLSNAAGGAGIADGTGIGTITNDDVAPPAGSVSIADISIVEGNSGTSTLVFTLTRTGGTAAFDVNFATANGGNPNNASATAGSDYVVQSGTASFADGQTTQTISITINGDTTAELSEEFTITLSGATNGATISDAIAIGTITTDDALSSAPANPWINEFHYDNAGTDTGEFVEIAGAAGTNLTGWTIALYNGNPSQLNVYATLTLSGTISNQSGGFGTIQVAGPAGGIQNGGAGANTEPDGIALVNPMGQVVEFISYEGVMTPTSGPANGMTSVNVGNGVFEPGDVNGTSIVRVSGPAGGTWAVSNSPSPGAVNPEQTLPTGGSAVPGIAVTDVSVNEAAGTVTFTVTRTNVAAGAFTVAYATADGTATAGVDYAATSGVLSFTDNQVQAQVTVTINDDGAPELDETFFLNLSNPTGGATIVDGQGVGTILNDDGTPIQISINDVSIAEGNSGTQILTFTVTRTGGTGAFDVNFGTANDSATAPSDYLANSGTLNFAMGENSKTISITINGDTIPESTEQFFVNLSAPTNGAVIVDGQGVGTIVNDEATFIHDIQGTAYFSPILAGEGISTFNVASAAFVTVQAIVTAVDNVGNKQGFFLQEEITDWDGNKYTSEGIFVMTRNDAGVGTVVSGVAVGDLVTVTARVMEYQGFAGNMPITALVNASSIVVNGSGNSLPAFFLDAGHPIPNSIMTAVTPDYTDSADGAGDTFDAALYGLSYWETVEGMLVTVPDMVVADGFVGSSGGRPFFQAYSTVHADADQINSRGGYTIAGDPPNSPPDTPETDDGTTNGGRVLHDGDINPDIIELDWTGFAAAPPTGLAAGASMGDLLGDVTGIIDFDFTDRKLFVTSMEPGGFVDNGSPVQETTTFGDDDRSLTVATFNVENLDPGDGAARFTALANAIANNLNSPDIICIEEMQDNNGATSTGGADASTTWQMLVDALNLATGKVYQWVDQEPVAGAEGGEPGGNIRVGFLYDTGRVQLGNLGANATLAERRQYTDRIGDGVRDAGDLIAFSDNMLGGEINTSDWTTTRKSLLGEFNFHGNIVYVTANHWPAKGGSGDFWQFDQNLGSGQPDNSDWAQRNAIAQDVYTMLNLIQTTNANAGIVAGGDFNDFYFYRPLEVLTGYVLPDGSVRSGGARFDNLTLTLSEAERYTYTFDGRSQAIDHIIANQLLSAVASYDVVHLNTGYNPTGSPALSDHDPGVSTFDYRNFGEVLVGTSGNDAIAGLGGNDNISTGQGNDSLNGGTGIDTLAGGQGNDLYFVDNALDVIVEAAGEGDDRVGASVSYALAAGVSVETLVANPDSVTTPINLSGNALAQTIVGNAGDNVLLGFAGVDQLVGLGGNDVLVGGFGADILRGGLGNDIYGIDEQDQLFENAGEGDDTAAVSATAGSYYLNAGSSIETLSTANQASTAAQNLIGNELGQSLFGSEGANVLNGGGGNDLLMGYGGADIFLFNTALGAGNVDVIADLVHGTDRIALDNAVFAGLQEGNLGAEAFVTGSAAADANDRIIYNQATGQLFFDADGNGNGAAVLFATLNGNPTLTVSDFLVI